MPVTNILRRKIANELQSWVYLGIREAMVKGAKEYQALRTSDPTLAVNMLKRAIDMPRRARHRIDYAIATYGENLITNSLNRYSDCTLVELNAEVDYLVAYAQDLYVRRTVQGENWSPLAKDIIDNVPEDSKQWNFPLPPGYLDIWGE